VGVIELSVRIVAPRERVFDLARSIDAHVASTPGTDERPVARAGGRTAGLMALGDEVTWRARHLGIVQHLTSRIVAYDRPRHFRDSMVRGAFARFDHDHYFEDDGPETTSMRDVFDFTSPLGALGRAVDALYLDGYMRRFVVRRAQILKELAEGDRSVWARFLDARSVDE
jgi:ligand-binding SRPBCC domain-containing protein